MIPSQFQPIANHLWQSTLFAATAGLLALLLRKYGPQARYALWLAASAKFLVPFSLLMAAGGWLSRNADVPVAPPISLAIQQVNEPFTSEPFVTAAPGVATALPNESISASEWVPTALWTVWGLGSTFIVFRWLSGWRRIRATLRAASPNAARDGVPVLLSPEILEPGIVGIFHPILLLPQGIESHLTPLQLEAVLQHEIVHVRRRDNLTALIHRAVEVLFWFHPLVWWIGARLIEARERACDESVLRSGIEPEAYGEGILKVCELYLKSPLPFVTGVTGSNLKIRMELIMSRSIAPQLSFARKAVLVAAGLGALAAPIAIGMLSVPILTAQSQSPSQPTPRPIAQLDSQPASQSKSRPPSQIQAQVQQPRQATSPEPVWTPSSGAPARLLTALEGGHHDKFIERARAGNIDLVFFGATDTEMWSWPDSILGGVDRGKRVWDQAFGSLKAANFGSQGTHSESLLWRMQHGELDGYEAKLVVLHSVGVKSISGGQLIGNSGDQPIGDRQAEFVAGYARLIAEIRARQPQAKILILPPFPRGRLRREEWRTVADANAVAYRRLADDSTVFYANFGDRFFLPDGSHNQDMWTIPGPPNAGIHEPGFKVWAEELQPWLDRFVR
ncbi:MAG: hypothetical protein LAO55_23150 [Acidobacteriia bacterium]|nr:hypothetical protein [Terriglobia bacterium]